MAVATFWFSQTRHRSISGLPAGELLDAAIPYLRVLACKYAQACHRLQATYSFASMQEAAGQLHACDLLQYISVLLLANCLHKNYKSPAGSTCLWRNRKKKRRRWTNSYKTIAPSRSKVIVKEWRAQRWGLEVQGQQSSMHVCDTTICSTV